MSFNIRCAQATTRGDDTMLIKSISSSNLSLHFSLFVVLNFVLTGDIPVLAKKMTHFTSQQEGREGEVCYIKRQINAAQRLIDAKVEEISGKVKQGDQVEGMYLTYLLSSNKLSPRELYISITELLLGGVDTTSNTLSWTLYHLSRDEAAQERLYQEITSVCPGKQLPTKEHVDRMPYLKAVIREILRLYPVVPGNARLTVDNEVIVDNYWFPKNTQFHLCHYATSRDSADFPEPDRFLPERWLRDSPTRSQHHPYSSIPFGVGTRACLGKRVAELEMYFALSRLIQTYLIRPEDSAVTVEPKTRTLLIPSKPINLRFFPRA